MQRFTAIQIVNYWSVPHVKELKPVLVMSKTWNRALILVMSISGNIQQMFYAFPVYGKHRDYLRFFEFENNDLEKPLIQYRMKSRGIREFACLKNFLHVHT